MSDDMVVTVRFTPEETERIEAEAAVDARELAKKYETEFDGYIEEKEAAEIRTRIQDLRISIERNYMEMGGCLNDVLTKRTKKEVPVWKSWGYDSFNDYCEKEIGFKSRKGYYILSIWRKIKDGNLPGGVIESVGWSKAALLTQLSEAGGLTAENQDDWMTAAKNKTHEELKQMVQLAREQLEDSESDTQEPEKDTIGASFGTGGNVGGGGGTVKDIDFDTDDGPKTKASKQTGVPEVFTFRVGLFADQHNNWTAALDKAKRITGSDKVPHLVDCIALAFNSEVFEEKTTAVEVLLQRVERAFGIKILAVDNTEDANVLYASRGLEPSPKDSTEKAP